ncbi:actin-binding protein wsp1-like [Phragmites australis]|uniref:actin-binding protein wsp1-like n=1 Tax=Phragmites australis TaxID=29695 RepID=UPI002D79E163|nr:actin-binding protein wsp1-like [Phragmites australis]
MPIGPRAIDCAGAGTLTARSSHGFSLQADACGTSTVPLANGSLPVFDCTSPPHPAAPIGTLSWAVASGPTGAPVSDLARAAAPAAGSSSGSSCVRVTAPTSPVHRQLAPVPLPVSPGSPTDGPLLAPPGSPALPGSPTMSPTLPSLVPAAAMALPPQPPTAVPIPSVTNDHPMVTRGMSGFRQPKEPLNLQATPLSPILKTYRGALTDPNGVIQ